MLVVANQRDRTLDGEEQEVQRRKEVLDGMIQAVELRTVHAMSRLDLVQDLDDETEHDASSVKHYN